jgi:hypothetical protein
MENRIAFQVRKGYVRSALSKIATIATAIMDGKEIAFRIPAGAEIVVIERLRVDSQQRTLRVKVESNSQVVTMFAVDIKDRGEAV